MNERLFQKGANHSQIALLLQGGGALGAFQAGVFETLYGHGFSPDWIAGTSIGAVQGALVAGHRTADPVTALKTFWEAVSDPAAWGTDHLSSLAQEMNSNLSVLASLLRGRNAFFTPRLAPPLTRLQSVGAESASYYDVTPLRKLLLRLIDFERINVGPTRLSLGAVNVETGELRYFDSRDERIGVEHVLASAALPPAFPAVRVGDHYYWDGGIYSNTPLEAILDDNPRRNTLCFAVVLFAPDGPEPRSLPEVEARRKDIVYGTRARQHIAASRRTHTLRRAIQSLYAQLPEESSRRQENQELAALGCTTHMDVVPIVYRSSQWESANKDADFSRASIRRRWQLGREHALRCLEHKPWLSTAPRHEGVTVHRIN